MIIDRKALYRFILQAALAGALSACGLVAPPAIPTEPPPSPTSAPPTATLAAVPPTDAPTPVPPTPTALPTSTPDAAATEAALAAATAAPMLAKIDKELSQYGLSTDEGHLGWLHDPFTVDLDSYMAEDVHTDYPDLVASDFVMQADITWNTTSGLAGCGFALRAGSDFDHGDSYRVYLIRLGPLWDIEYYETGKFFSNLTGIRDALPLDDGVNSTNKITAIVQGNKLGVYANGQELDTITDIRLTKGTPAFISWQESGKTSCTFENGWLWVLKD